MHHASRLGVFTNHGINPALPYKDPKVWEFMVCSLF